MTNGASITPAGLGYESQWSPGVADASQAVAVGVASGLPTTVDAAMVELGEITGTITETETGVPAESADVQAFNADHSLALSAPAFTAADGTYTLQAAVPGHMVVQIEDSNDQRFSPQYVGGAYVASEGRSVAVSSGAVTTGVNQAIVGRGTVKGSIRRNKSTGIAPGGVAVDELDAAGKPIARASASGGAYSINVPAGVPVRFQFGAGSSTYAPQFYNDRPSLSCADPVTVAANATRVNISAGGGKGPSAAQIKSSLESRLAPTGSRATHRRSTPPAVTPTASAVSRWARS